MTTSLTPKQTIKKMIYAGMHFGHQKKNWNPKMAPYIYTERNGIHIIDLIQTYSFPASLFIFNSSCC